MYLLRDSISSQLSSGSRWGLDPSFESFYIMEECI